MSIEELLKPRYKVIADYPGNPHKIGHILEYVKDTDWDKKNIETCNKYPSIFKKLEWWEERNVNDLPPYLKNISDTFTDTVKKGEVITLKDFKWWGFHKDTDTWQYFYPATEEDYIQYQQNKNVCQ